MASLIRSHNPFTQRTGTTPGLDRVFIIISEYQFQYNSSHIRGIFANRDFECMGLNISSTNKVVRLRVLSSHSKTSSSTEPVCSLDVSCDGYLLASSHESFIVIWDLDRLSVLTTLQGHRETVVLIRFTSSSWRLASCSIDGSIRVWGRQSGKWKCENVIQSNHSGWDWSCSWLMGDALASVGTNGRLNLWDSIHAHVPVELIGSEPVHTRSAKCVACITVTPNIYLITAGNDSVITISELSRNPKGIPHLSILRHIAPIVPGEVHDMTSYEFNRNGESVFAVVGSDKSVRIWNMKDVLDWSDDHILLWNRKAINVIRFSADGRHFAIGDTAGIITVYRSPIPSLGIRVARVWSYRIRMGSIRSLAWTSATHSAIVVGLSSGKIVRLDLPSKLRNST